MATMVASTISQIEKLKDVRLLKKPASELGCALPFAIAYGQVCTYQCKIVKTALESLYS